MFSNSARFDFSTERRMRVPQRNGWWAVRACSRLGHLRRTCIERSAPSRRNIRPSQRLNASGPRYGRAALILQSETPPHESTAFLRSPSAGHGIGRSDANDSSVGSQLYAQIRQGYDRVGYLRCSRNRRCSRGSPDSTWQRRQGTSRYRGSEPPATVRAGADHRTNR
jgi:hypothetical protein